MYGARAIGDVVERCSTRTRPRSASHAARFRRSGRLADSGSRTRLPSRLPTPDSRLRRPSPDSRQSLWFLDLETTGSPAAQARRRFSSAAPVSTATAASRPAVPAARLRARAGAARRMVGLGGGRAARIVTFNGRSFDVPLIETRYLFHRLPFPLEGMRARGHAAPRAAAVARARRRSTAAPRRSCSLRHARTPAGRGPPRRRRAGLRDPLALFPVRARRRRAAARSGAGAQPPRPGVAGAGDGARAHADRARTRRRARRLRVPGPGAGLRQAAVDGTMPRRRMCGASSC